ncbi:MAG: hypothetical protein LBF76_01900 [Holosporales bacterium]|nr:hypothetical protein [Holosporales bacterium]
MKIFYCFPLSFCLFLMTGSAMENLFPEDFPQKLRRAKSEETLLPKQAHSVDLQERGSSVKAARVEFCSLPLDIFADIYVKHIPRRWKKPWLSVFALKKDIPIDGLAFLQNFSQKSEYISFFCKERSCLFSHGYKNILMIHTPGIHIFPIIKEHITDLDPDSISGYIEAMRPY